MPAARSAVPPRSPLCPRVLLVEDDPGDAELVQIWLRRSPETRFDLWHVETLGDAEGCLVKADFDLALVDLSLPDASGPWPFHALHDRHPEVPVIVLTRFDEIELGEKLVTEGACDHLVKGQVSGDTLIRTMRHVVERGRLARELRALREEAETGPRARAELVAELSQEVRTPLHTVLGMADLLLETELTREQEGYVRSALRASESLLARVDGLLGDPGRSADVAAPGARSRSEGPAPALRVGGVDASHLRVLLVNDAEESRRLVRAQLADAGHDVETAGDGREALQRFEADDYDLVLMDMQMPGMDGFEAARAMRRWEGAAGRTATPILALTALSTPADVAACLEAGCDAHLARPVTKPVLLDALMRFAPKHHARLLRVEATLADGVDRYLHDRHNDLAALRLALEADDMESVRMVGRDLEDGAASRGFTELAAIGRTLQEAGRDGDRDGAARGLANLTSFLRDVKLVVG